LPSLIIVAALLLVIRIFYLQVINDTFKLKSDNNAIKIKYDYPERVIYMTETEELLVSNQASYDIMVIPRELKNIDTLEFANFEHYQEDYIKTIAKKLRYIVHTTIRFFYLN
jgi:penicillin-binding protein 2